LVGVEGADFGSPFSFSLKTVDGVPARGYDARLVDVLVVETSFLSRCETPIK
jgi:hypothetical protein